MPVYKIFFLCFCLLPNLWCSYLNFLDVIPDLISCSYWTCTSMTCIILEKNSLSLSLPLLSPLTILDFIYRHATSLQYFIWAMCFFFAIFIISSLFASVWIFSFYFSFSSAVLSRSVSNIGKSIDFWVELYFYLYDFPLFLFTIFYFSAEISSTLINSMNTLTIMY